MILRLLPLLVPLLLQISTAAAQTPPKTAPHKAASRQVAPSPAAPHSRNLADKTAGTAQPAVTAARTGASAGGTAVQAAARPVKTESAAPVVTAARIEPAQTGDEVNASPKQGWGVFPIYEEQVGHPWWEYVLLWLPNRFLDLVDVFRVDAGIGPSFGAVIRLSRYAQAGYREMSPGSLRIGDFGRDWPAMLETSNEFGVSPFYVKSKDRKICLLETGAGVDLFIAGVYGGICIDELVDFAAGLFFIDLKDDDM